MGAVKTPLSSVIAVPGGVHTDLYARDSLDNKAAKLYPKPYNKP